MQQIKLWKIEADKINQINKDKLDYERRLEKWLIEDISVISSNLVVIGSQIFTPFGKIIDILALNSVGEIIIIELKRDKTYREVIAQSLDYATWVKELDYEDLNGILNKYSDSAIKDIGELFSATFNTDAEEVEFNSDHKMLIVGSEIDDSTVRIINYLSSEPYSVNINAVNFNYFKDENGNEFLAQSFIIPEETITEKSKSKNRKRAKSTFKVLFDTQKLKIGDKVFFNPALDNGYDKDNPQISAEIVNLGGNCLRRENENITYSFSKLRKIITEELNLDVKTNWGFGVRYDWVTANNTNLSDLLDE